MLIGKKYYNNETEIKEKGLNNSHEECDPLRRADNRINHNFHELLVDEKAAYMFTYPVLFDTSNNTINQEIQHVLGDDFERISKNLCIEASNCGIAWLHYWIDVEKKEFKYAIVNSEEVFPLYENGLEKKLIGAIRTYTRIEDVDGVVQEESFTYIEYWTDKEMTRYRFRGISYNGDSLTSEDIDHKLGSVPFIEFANNNKKQNDLYKYKDQIDLYNRVLSGFANDLEDIQQIIYILENYGGQNLSEFLGDLKRYKAIKVDSDGTGNSGGVKTLQIEIPVEAKKIILEILRRQIYESGQGLQQEIESVGNASGVALKFFYRKLELKAGLLETEFRSGFNQLVRAILIFLNKPSQHRVIQTYTRNMISNDAELADIATKSIGVTSSKTIIKNHPWVESVEDEELQMKKEEKERQEQYAPYPTSLSNDQSKEEDGYLNGKEK